MTSLAQTAGHQHQLPNDHIVDVVLDHTAFDCCSDRAIDPRPLVAALTAAVARCRPCQVSVARWMARYGDPRALARLSAPVAHHAYRLATSWIRTTRGTTASIRVVVRSLLYVAFGNDVADLATSWLAGDHVKALRHVRRLDVPHRELLVAALLDAIANPPPPALLALAERGSGVITGASHRSTNRGG